MTRYSIQIYRQNDRTFNRKMRCGYCINRAIKIAEFDDVELEINYPTTFSFYVKQLVMSP